MIIRSIKISNLQGRKDFDLKFNEDVNIITGPNGSGKTTLIKVIWYLISGNIERVFREVEFDSLLLKTSNYELHIQIVKDIINLTIKENTIITSYKFILSTQQAIEPKNSVREINDLNYILIKLTPGSVFFPTFRRVEGGFSLTENDDTDRLVKRPTPEGQLQHGLAELSKKLSVVNNYFISSISTHDITDLLRKKHSENSEEVNLLHIGMSEFIEKKIESIQPKTTLKTKDAILSEIQKKVASITAKRTHLLSPFTTLSQLISDIFQHKGIKFTDKFSVGDTERAISSAKMSAGEKQLLSFICYNAFCQNIPFIIDEPELSLHVDWQRNLLPILKSQKSGNQIIIATHSPFIYSKYPEKEIVLTN